MADQETKFSEEELKSLQDLQTSYQQKQLQFGQLKVQKSLSTAKNSFKKLFGNNKFSRKK